MTFRDILTRAARWLATSASPSRASWAYCPECRRDLNGDSFSFLSDDDRGVRYRCADCRLVSVWDFGAPAPVLLSTDGP